VRRWHRQSVVSCHIQLPYCRLEFKFGNSSKSSQILDHPHICVSKSQCLGTKIADRWHILFSKHQTIKNYQSFKFPYTSGYSLQFRHWKFHSDREAGWQGPQRIKFGPGTPPGGRGQQNQEGEPAAVQAKLPKPADCQRQVGWPHGRGPQPGRRCERWPILFRI
jgi:hypothetical protein